MAGHAHERSAAGGAVVVCRGGSGLVAAQRGGNGRSDDSGEHTAPASQGRRPTFPATTGDAITLGQCLSPGLDHHPGRALQSAPPPAWALRSGALAPPQGQAAQQATDTRATSCRIRNLPLKALAPEGQGKGEGQECNHVFSNVVVNPASSCTPSVFNAIDTRLY